MKKAAKFFLKIILAIFILAVIFIILYFINKFFKIINIPLSEIKLEFQHINRVFFTQLVAGISVGTLLLLIFIFILPFFTKKINTKEYMKNIILGVIASFVFFISQTIFQYFEKFGKFYMIASIIGVAIITFIIVELMSLAFQTERREVKFRTAILGCIASGLIFGIVLNVVLLVMDYLKFSIR